MTLNNWIVEHYESSTMNFYKDVNNINDEDVGDCRKALKNISDETIQAPLQPRSYGKIKD